MVTRRAVLGTLTAASLSAQRRGRPNFLFLMADDHAGYAFGADGDELAHTPNLDRLAGQSVRFAQHFCNSPMCTPSRQSLFTGQMPHMAGVTRLMTPLSDDKPTIARQLRKCGYTTAVFGKMHFQRPPFPGQHGFDYPITEDEVERRWMKESRPTSVPSHIATRPKWRPLKDPARIWLNADKLPYPRTYEDMKSTWMARQANEFMEQNRERPFALWVSFTEPHSPFDFPIEDRKRFDPETVPIPSVRPADHWQIPLIFRDLTERDKRGIKAAYYTSVGFLDRNIGVVLDKLRALNLDENTVVVYTADHGYCLGHHGRFEKHCGYEEALRVPLLVRQPGRFKPRVITDLTDHLDLAATILDVLEAESLPVNHGRSLRAYLDSGKNPRRKDYLFAEYLENEEAYLRTQRHKFIYCSGKRARQEGYKTENPTPGRYWRLFDLQKDPGEFDNIADANRDLVERFKCVMLERFRATHPDAGAEPAELGRDDLLDWYLQPRD